MTGLNGANNPDHPLAVDDLALFTHWLDARANLHVPFLRLILSVSVNDTTAFEVVRSHLNHNAVARQDADVVHTHFAGDVSKYDMAVLKLDTEHRIGQGLNDRTLELNYFLCTFLRVWHI